MAPVVDNHVSRHIPTTPHEEERSIHHRGAPLLCTAGVGYYLWEREHFPAAKAVKVLRSFLFDPESSQFQEIKHFSGTGATCGLVNAKNRMGGYVGFTTFVVTKRGEVLFDPMADTESGTTEERLAAIERKIAFLERVHAECLEPASPSASIAK